MFNIKQTVNTTYAEVGQVNPLRWKTLFREDDTTFTDQSGWIKCKDFYNDTVAFFKEKSKFSIYGYQNDIKKNNEGVYFLLKFIKDKEVFLHNINVMNWRLKEDLGCAVSVDDYENDQLVILIPNELWESTYRISMVTMVVRLCNYGVKYEKWADFWAEGAPALTVDKPFTPKAIANARTLGFLVPEKFRAYWFYCGPDYNSVKAPRTTGGVIHNNGVSSWSEYMSKEAA